VAKKTKRKIRRPAKAQTGRLAVTFSDLMNYAQAAAYLGIAEATLQSWVERSTHAVPHIRLGRLVRFRPASLSRWLESRERGGNMFAVAPATQLEAR